MESKFISHNTKIKIYKTPVRPVVTYGSETWTLIRKEQETVKRFERKIITRVCGPVNEDYEWRIRNNQETDEPVSYTHLQLGFAISCKL